MKRTLIFSATLLASLICATETSFADTVSNSARWALPHISVAHVRTEPRHSAELSTQALMGNPLRVLEHTPDGWVKIEMPDGYTGYIIDNSLTLMTDDQLRDWNESPRLIVTSVVEVDVLADAAMDEPVSDLVPGDIVCGLIDGPWTHVTLPDGRHGWFPSGFLAKLDEWADDPASIPNMLFMANQQLGEPYLWGGLSPKGMDCSGLTKLTFLSGGIILPRDASQQAVVGLPIPTDSVEAGDLLFFGPAPGRINHVAIYEGDGYILESSGRVRRTSLDEKTDLLSARRIVDKNGQPVTPDVVRMRHHPWYAIDALIAANASGRRQDGDVPWLRTALTITDPR